MADPIEPVSALAETTEAGPAPGIGLAISGGGYRAMLFHLGSFLRLFEVGLLKKLDRISSVSGGSITYRGIITFDSSRGALLCGGTTSTGCWGT